MSVAQGNSYCKINKITRRNHPTESRMFEGSLAPLMDASQNSIVRSSFAIFSLTHASLYFVPFSKSLRNFAICIMFSWTWGVVGDVWGQN